MIRSSTNRLVLLIILDQILTLTALAIAATIRLGDVVSDLDYLNLAGLPPFMYLLVSLLWLFILTLVSVYDARRIAEPAFEFQTLLLGIMLSALVLAGSLYLLNYVLPRLLYLYFVFLDTVFLVGYRILLRLVVRVRNHQAHGLTRTVIAGAGKLGERIADELAQMEGLGVRLVGFLDDDRGKVGSSFCGVPVLGRCDEAVRVAQSAGIDEVIVALPPSEYDRLVNLVSDLQRVAVRVKVVPDYFDLAFARVTGEKLGDIPIIELRDSAITGFPRLAKRIFDLVVAIPGAIIASPIILLIAIAIKWDSPGRAIIKQQRVGENGSRFWMYKFRSMTADAENGLDEHSQVVENGQAVHKQRDDPRVTRMGRWLRRTSLDELPQLFNVIRGEMSLVGPRPELPWLVERYEPWQRKRFAVPQGMTGWWQINGRSDRMMHLNTQDDLYYIQNYSLLLDLQILWKTIGVVFKGRGAY